MNPPIANKVKGEPNKNEGINHKDLDKWRQNIN